MVAEKVKAYRIARGLTQEELATRIQKSPTLITKIETNTTNPSLSTLEKIAKALGVSITELLQEESA